MKKIIALLFGSFVFFYACKKELSFETDTTPVVIDPTIGTSDGMLGGSPATCSNATIFGIFAQNVAVTDSNYLTVEVTVTTAGTYTIVTDTVNGISFNSSGSFATTGAQVVKLKAFGKPLNPGTFAQTVKYKASRCTFAVDAYPLATAPGTDYFPTTANSNWTYGTDDPTIPPSDTIRTTSTNFTLTATGNTYNLFENLTNDAGSIVKDSAYYRKSSGNYYQYNNADFMNLTGTPLPELIILKDNVAQGSTWESAAINITLLGTPTMLKFVNKLKAKNVTKLVSNKAFANVIVVSTSVQVNAPLLGYQEAISYEVWYAKGVGIIYQAETTGGVTSTASIVQRYQIF